MGVSKVCFKRFRISPLFLKSVIRLSFFPGFWPLAHQFGNDCIVQVGSLGELPRMEGTFGSVQLTLSTFEVPGHLAVCAADAGSEKVRKNVVLGEMGVSRRGIRANCVAAGGGNWTLTRCGHVTMGTQGRPRREVASEILACREFRKGHLQLGVVWAEL